MGFTSQDSSINDGSALSHEMTAQIGNSSALTNKIVDEDEVSRSDIAIKKRLSSESGKPTSPGVIDNVGLYDIKFDLPPQPG